MNQPFTVIRAALAAFVAASALLAPGCAKPTEDPKIDPAKVPAGAAPHASERNAGMQSRRRNGAAPNTAP